MPALNRIDISILIPTKNRINFLRRALASALSQVDCNLQVVVSDNASTDGTKEWLNMQSDHRLSVLNYEEPVGMYENWNRCLSAAEGQYVVCLSDDDFLSGDFCSKTLRQIRAIGAKVALTGFWQINESCGVAKVIVPTPNRHLYYEFILDWLSAKRNITPCACVLDRTRLLQSGGYVASAGLAADAAAFINCLDDRGVAIVSEPLSYYTVHGTSTWLLQSPEEMARNLAKLKAAIQKKIVSVNLPEHVFDVLFSKYLGLNLFYSMVSRSRVSPSKVLIYDFFRNIRSLRIAGPIKLVSLFILIFLSWGLPFFRFKQKSN